MSGTLMRVLLAAVVCCGAIGESFAQCSCDGHSYSLFDGRTLDGWNIENDCRVAVQDGMMVLESGNGWLRSDHQYGDFRLHVEWQALQAEKYDAGIYLRTLPGGDPFPKRGYQVNLQQGREGNIIGVEGATSTGLIHPAGEWNSFDLTVVGDRVETWINGCLAYRASGITIPRGHVGIQVEVPLGGQFRLRNLWITELGYRTLFSGCDLSAWEGADAPLETSWRVENDVLECTGTKGTWLRTREEYGDFNLRLEYLVSEEGNSGIYVRVPKDGNHHRANASLPPAGFEVQLLDDAAAKHRALKDYQYSASVYDIAGATSRVSKPAGQWNTLELNCAGQHVTCVHNGVMVIDAPVEKFPLLGLRQTRGYLGLQNHGSRVKFRNIRIGRAVETGASTAGAARKAERPAH